MKIRHIALLLLSVMVSLLGMSNAPAAPRHVWTVTSPDHEQTFSYGSEQNRVWATRGSDRHLAVLLTYTNDPYVSRTEPRQTDNFTFGFPGVTLGKDGRTFYLHTDDGRSIPVAVKREDFFGIDEIKLLPGAELIVRKPHGYITLSLVIWEPAYRSKVSAPDAQ